ncbi:MAG TPA: DNA polymerase III subunit [Patescibacteria group bacterium]|nr:DNA polymerase III subunit [Patescibacteria group bacterium]
MTSEQLQFQWDICGHENVASFLQSAIIGDNVAHAYLLVGSKHLGKHALAKEFISSIFCQTNGGITPCGECVHCRQLKNNLHPDVYQVERQINEKTGKLKKNISVDQIRDLKNKLQQATLFNSYKVAIIAEAEQISISAANALLKVLEEPTPKTVIILITSDIGSIPVTIISRSQVIKFLPVATKDIESFLASHNMSADAKKIAKLSFGQPGIAIALSTHQDVFDKYIKDINDFFNLIDANINDRFNIMDDLIVWNRDEAINTSQINKLFNNWQIILRDLMLCQNNNEPLIANFDYLTRINALSSRFSLGRISKILKHISLSKKYFRQNVGSRLILENLIINI